MVWDSVVVNGAHPASSARVMPKPELSGWQSHGSGHPCASAAPTHNTAQQQSTRCRGPLVNAVDFFRPFIRIGIRGGRKKRCIHGYHSFNQDFSAQPQRSCPCRCNFYRVTANWRFVFEINFSNSKPWRNLPPRQFPALFIGFFIQNEQKMEFSAAFHIGCSHPRRWC